jgi:hypothetical protein
MDPFVTLLSSTLVAAVVGASAGYLSQRSLANRQARLAYEYEAKKRLYAAVGPLRFQLLVASRDVVRRVATHHLGQRWNMKADQYYGRSFLYRLLRPLAVSALIERQMSYADFSVDDSAVDLLRFETSAYRMLTGRDPLPYYHGLDWASETQHVFRDNLRAAAIALIRSDSNGNEVVLDFSEFTRRYPNPREDAALAPLANLLESAGDSLLSSPIFFTRVLGYAYCCSWLLRQHGGSVGFEPRTLEVSELLEATGDGQILEHLDEYPRLFDAVLNEGL